MPSSRKRSTGQLFDVKQQEVRPRRWRLPLLFVIFVVLLGPLLVACGGGETQPSQPTVAKPKPTPPPAPPPRAEGQVFVSSTEVPLLQFPNGIAAWHGRVYAAVTAFTTSHKSHILIFDAKDGKFVRSLGDGPDQIPIQSGNLTGMAIDPQTGDLFSALSTTGDILHIHNADSVHPSIDLYATLPPPARPEDMVFGTDGTLFVSDSRQGVIYAFLPGGGPAHLFVGPPGSNAPIIDNDSLLKAPAEGLSPNGLAISPDGSTLYVSNTWSDSIVAVSVFDAEGQATGETHLFAQQVNPDLHAYPTGMEILKLARTRIGKTAASPLNGPNGLAMDSVGNLWIASMLGDRVSVLDPSGRLVASYGTSAVTEQGLLNNPTGLAFLGTTVYSSNMGLFTGLAGKPKIPFRIVAFNVGIPGSATEATT